MEFKIPNKNKKKRKNTTSPTSNIAKKLNIRNVNVSGANTSMNHSISSNSSSSTIKTDIPMEVDLNINESIAEQTSSTSPKNSLLNNPIIPEKLKKLYRIFQTINKYFTLKQSRNTELFIFENYKTIIENELKWYLIDNLIIEIIIF